MGASNRPPALAGDGREVNNMYNKLGTGYDWPLGFSFKRLCSNGLIPKR